YRQAAEMGAEEVLSIHIGSSISGTVQSARLACASSPVPVTVVDTGQASFEVGLCVLEGIQALVEGKGATDAAVLVGAASRSVGNTFVVKALDLARRGGRLVSGEDASAGIPVLVLTGEGMKVAGTAKTLDDATDLIAGEVAAKMGVKAALAERHRVGGDCLWTGCVPSKALLASAKAAHTMRHADKYGLAPAEIEPGTASVWRRIRDIQQEIAATDDN